MMQLRRPLSHNRQAGQESLTQTSAFHAGDLAGCIGTHDEIAEPTALLYIESGWDEAR